MHSVSDVKEKEELEEWLQDPEFQNILQPYTYLNETPGKEMRIKFGIMFNHWTDVPQEKLNAISDLIMELHQFSLLLDDIQDNSVLRRGKPVAHKIYGVPRCLNALSLLQNLLVGKFLSLGGLQAAEACIDGTLQMIKGQGMELYWRDNFVCPSEEEYILMAKRKTGTLFALIVKLLQLFSAKHIDATEFGNQYGLYFQIQDDYQNLTNENYFKMKGFCEDITEGKFSFPIVHAINNYPEARARIIDILKLRTDDVVLKKECLAILEKCGSIEYTRQKVEIAKNAVIQKSIQLGYNPNFGKFLDETTHGIYVDGKL